jgi:hypothetical protein
MCQFFEMIYPASKWYNKIDCVFVLKALQLRFQKNLLCLLSMEDRIQKAPFELD